MTEEKLSRKLLKSIALEHYERNVDHLWNQSVRLNANVFLFKRIAKFPFDLFGDVDNQCWGLLADSLYESSALSIWRLACDRRNDVLTVHGFKKWINANCKNKAASIELSERLRELRIDQIDNGSIKRVEEFRHYWLAHLGRVESVLADTSGLLPSHNELQRFCDAIQSDVNTLSLDSERMRTYPQYDDTIGPNEPDKRTDIDRLLDLVASHSDAFNMPEEQPGYWPTHRDGFTHQQAVSFDSYRVRLGSSPAARQKE